MTRPKWGPATGPIVWGWPHEAVKIHGYRSRVVVIHHSPTHSTTHDQWRSMCGRYVGLDVTVAEIPDITVEDPDNVCATCTRKAEALTPEETP